MEHQMHSSEGDEKDHEMHHEHGMEHEGKSHHAQMLEDFKKRFIISSILTIPVLILSPAVQGLLGFEFAFPNSNLVLLGLSTIIYLYGGHPFLKGIFTELKARNPGMMTLIAIAISVAYIYSSAVVLGLPGKFFFWELVTLIDVMLLGHWMEMRSVMGASGALDELAQLMPDTAERVTEGGD